MLEFAGGFLRRRLWGLLGCYLPLCCFFRKRMRLRGRNIGDSVRPWRWRIGRMRRELRDFVRWIWRAARGYGHGFWRRLDIVRDGLFLRDGRFREVFTIEGGGMLDGSVNMICGMVLHGASFLPQRPPGMLIVDNAIYCHCLLFHRSPRYIDAYPLRRLLYDNSNESMRNMQAAPCISAETGCIMDVYEKNHFPSCGATQCCREALTDYDIYHACYPDVRHGTHADHPGL